MLVAYKPYSSIPEIDRPEDIHLDTPWCKQDISEEELDQFVSYGFSVVTLSEYSAIVESTSAQNQLALARRDIKNKIKAAIDFGEKITLDFTTENVLLGIAQDNMTSYVLERMSGVLAALQTGSLYDAIAKAKSIPVSSYDIKYITAARLLKFVNNIESYLGRPLSTSL